MRSKSVRKKRTKKITKKRSYRVRNNYKINDSKGAQRGVSKGKRRNKRVKKSQKRATKRTRATKRIRATKRTRATKGKKILRGGSISTFEKKYRELLKEKSILRKQKHFPVCTVERCHVLCPLHRDNRTSSDERVSEIEKELDIITPMLPAYERIQRRKELRRQERESSKPKKTSIPVSASVSASESAPGSASVSASESDTEPTAKPVAKPPADTESKDKDESADFMKGIEDFGVLEGDLKKMNPQELMAKYREISHIIEELTRWNTYLERFHGSFSELFGEYEAESDTGYTHYKDKEREHVEEFFKNTKDECLQIFEAVNDIENPDVFEDINLEIEGNEEMRRIGLFRKLNEECRELETKLLELLNNLRMKVIIESLIR